MASCFGIPIPIALFVRLRVNGYFDAKRAGIVRIQDVARTKTLRHGLRLDDGPSLASPAMGLSPPRTEGKW